MHSLEANGAGLSQLQDASNAKPLGVNDGQTVCMQRTRTLENKQRKASECSNIK
jgi:hypothetical protein